MSDDHLAITTTLTIINTMTIVNTMTITTTLTIINTRAITTTFCDNDNHHHHDNNHHVEIVQGGRLWVAIAAHPYHASVHNVTFVLDIKYHLHIKLS